MARISGVGHYVPPQVVTNYDLTNFMETSDEWIQQRSGIVERHWVRQGQEKIEGMRNIDMAAAACREALADAEIEADQIEAIFYATVAGDHEFPGPTCQFKELLGIGHSVGVYEIRNQCSGFLFALYTANAFVKCGTYKHVLVIGSELQSTGLDVSTRGRHMAVLFGDAAGAVVLSAKPAGSKEGIIAIELGADGTCYDKLGIKAPLFCRPQGLSLSDFEGESPAVHPFMDGSFVFKSAASKMPQAVEQILAHTGYTTEQVDLVIPHQANQRIIEMVGRALNISDKVYSNIASHGNTTAASIPLALYQARREGRVKPGSLVCLTSFGAGFSWGAALVRF